MFTCLSLSRDILVSLYKEATVLRTSRHENIASHFHSDRFQSVYPRLNGFARPNGQCDNNHLYKSIGLYSDAPRVEKIRR